MIRYGRRLRGFAICLSALAGYVDALGFIKLGGFFVSFMSGNSTRLGVGLAQNRVQAVVAGGLIAAFLAGVVIGSLTAHFWKSRRGSAVLLLVGGLLGLAAAFHTAQLTHPAVILMAVAMGAENAVFTRGGEVSIGVTYMTGTLVKLGQGITNALVGGDRLAWIWYFCLWLGLIVGAVTGALVYPHLGLAGLWFAAGAAVLLAVVAAKLPLGDGHAL